MSRIGKLPIRLPDGVDVNYNESEITVKGKFGELQTKIPDIIAITENDKSLKVNLNPNHVVIVHYMVYIEH